MKNALSFVTIMLLFTNFSFAQIATGFFAGGSIGLSSTSSKYSDGSLSEDGPKVSTTNFNPTVGYFLTDNIAGGVRVLYSKSKTSLKSNGQDNEASATGIGAEIFGRYFMPIGSANNFAAIAELGIGFGKVTGESKSGAVTIESDPISLTSVGISPGIVYFPSQKFGIEASLGSLLAYTSTTTTDASNDDNKSTESKIEFLNLNSLGLSFGIHYYINR